MGGGGYQATAVKEFKMSKGSSETPRHQSVRAFRLSGVGTGVGGKAPEARQGKNGRAGQGKAGPAKPMVRVENRGADDDGPGLSGVRGR